MWELGAGGAEFWLGATCGGGAVALSEFVDATGGIHKAGFAGEEGVARGADTDFQVLYRGMRVEHRATSAADGGFEGGGVDGVFHGMMGHGGLARRRGASTMLSPERGGMKNTGNCGGVKGFLQKGWIAKMEGFWSFLSR